ncbi:MAG: DNA adenine methylase [Thermofilum sp.]
MRYVDRYVREHYRRVWIRSGTYSKLLEICDKPLVDCIDELVGLAELPDRIFEEIKRALPRTEAKLIMYPGGDHHIKDELLSIALRAPIERGTFVEVFGGSGVMVQLVPRTRFPNVVYNDIDKDLVALHRLVKKNPDLLASVLYLIPYSRYVRAYISRSLAGRELGELLGAAMMFYLLNSGFFGLRDAGLGMTIKPGRSHARRYLSHIAAVYEAAKRLRDVTIECLSFEEVMRKYDSETTLFYLDPPYLQVEGGAHRSDFYRHSFTPGDVARLVRILKSLRGHFMLKIHEDNERFYKDVPTAGRVVVTKKLLMEMKRGEERRTFNYVILTSYRLAGRLGEIQGRFSSQ